METPVKEEEPIMVDCTVIITDKNNKPCIELRRVITDQTLIKLIVASALHNKPVYLQPRFTDTLQSLKTLQVKGIIYRKEDEYHFTF